MPLIKVIDGNNLFRRLYEKLGVTALPTLFQESIAHDPNTTIIWAWDGHNSKARRQAIYPDYKTKRNPATDEFHQTMDFFKDLLQHSNCLQMEAEGWEADDLIAHLVHNRGEADVEINSNDADFHALLDHEGHVTLQTEKELAAPPEEMRLYKALVGDASDAIGGLKGFGATRYQKCSKEELAMLRDCLERKREAIEVAEALEFTPKLKEHFVDGIETIRAGYDIIDFIEVPDEVVIRAIKAGVLNPELANEKLAKLHMEALESEFGIHAKMTALQAMGGVTDAK